jgi:cerevisin
MASPHTAGLLAYLLSIHGAPTFNPILKPEEINRQVSNWNPTAAIVAILPRWMSAFIPASLIENNVSTMDDSDDFYNEDGTLDVTRFGGIAPAQLKAALLDLGLHGKIDKLPANTINLLIFNNATDDAGHPWRK